MKYPVHILLISFISLFYSLTYSANLLAKENSVKLDVIDPFLEMHTGPGRGYPVIYTIEQGESIIVLTRRPDWYEIQSDNRKVGWVKASQIARTLQVTGEPVDLPSVSYGDYLKDSISVGFQVGEFSSGELSGAQTYTFTTAMRWTEWFSSDIELGSFYDSELRGRYYGINLGFEPWSDWVVSPYINLGGGKMSISVQPTLIPVSFDDSNYIQYGLGASYYLGRNFMISAGYRSYNLSTAQEERLNRWHFGFNAFF